MQMRKELCTFNCYLALLPHLKVADEKIKYIYSANQNAKVVLWLIKDISCKLLEHQVIYTEI